MIGVRVNRTYGSIITTETFNNCPRCRTTLRTGHTHCPKCGSSFGSEWDSNSSGGSRTALYGIVIFVLMGATVVAALYALGLLH